MSVGLATGHVQRHMHDARFVQSARLLEALLFAKGEHPVVFLEYDALDHSYTLGRGIVPQMRQEHETEALSLQIASDDQCEFCPLPIRIGDKPADSSQGTGRLECNKGHLTIVV